MAEWNDSSFTTLKVMWSEVAVHGAAYRVTYVPVGHTAGFVNTSIGTGGIVTTRDNSTFITALNPKEFYYLYVEVLAVNANSDQVAIGK